MIMTALINGTKVEDGEEHGTVKCLEGSRKSYAKSDLVTPNTRVLVK